MGEMVSRSGGIDGTSAFAGPTADKLLVPDLGTAWVQLEADGRDGVSRSGGIDGTSAFAGPTADKLLVPDLGIAWVL